MKTVLKKQPFVLLLCVVFASSGFGYQPNTPIFNDPSPIVSNTISPVHQLPKNTQMRSANVIRPMVLSGTDEQMARQFLNANIENLQLRENLPDLTVASIQSSPNGGRHIRFTQDYDGVKVEQSDVLVSIDNQDKVSYYMSSYHPDVSVQTTTPSLSSNDALQKTQDALKTKDFIGTPSCELVIVPLSANCKLAYRVQALCSDPRGDWLVYVDAQSGDIIWIHDLAQYINGTGSVFRPDPLSSAHHYYGSDGYVNRYVSRLFGHKQS